jgi:hypothetical protein
MARALSTQVKEFIDMWLSPTPLTNYTFSIVKYPYVHTLMNSRVYEYTVKDGFEMIMKTPWDIDLMGNFVTSNSITSVLKELTIPPDYDQLNKYKQIVVHRHTYTGLINVVSGTEEKVIEIRME